MAKKYITKKRPERASYKRIEIKKRIVELKKKIAKK